MKNTFAQKIREFREVHFKGQSLRSVALTIDRGDGGNFFTYLSKIENGTLPSTELLSRIMKAYKLADSEVKELWETYMIEKLLEDIAPATKNQGITLRNDLILFRKVRKNKRKQNED